MLVYLHILLIIHCVTSKAVFEPIGVVPNEQCSSVNCEDEVNYYCMAYGNGIDTDYPDLKPRTSPSCYRRIEVGHYCLYSSGNRMMGDRQCMGDHSKCSSKFRCIHTIGEGGHCDYDYEQCRKGLKCGFHGRFSKFEHSSTCIRQ